MSKTPASAVADLLVDPLLVSDPEQIEPSSQPKRTTCLDFGQLLLEGGAEGYGQ